MPPKITSAIPTQQFERNRAQICVILSEELQNQNTLDATIPALKKVWEERFIPFNGETEMPTINVSIQKTLFDNQSVRAADGTTTYNIDIYTAANSSVAKGPGDQYALKEMTRIAGIIATILRSPCYQTLGFAPSIIGHTMVEGFFIGDKTNVKDALSDVVGRLQFTVRAIEQSIITDVPVPLLNITSNVLLEDTDEGFVYVWSIETVITAPGGPSFTLPPQYAHLQVAVIFDGNQAYNTGFIQVGSLVTMTSNVSFPPGAQLDLRMALGDFTANVTLLASGNVLTLPASYASKQIGVIFDGTGALIRDAGFTQSGISVTLSNSYAAGTIFTFIYGSTIVPIVSTGGATFSIPEQYQNMNMAVVCDGTQAYNSTQFIQSGLSGTMTNGVSFSPDAKLTIILR